MTVLSQFALAYVEIVVCVKLPELAVNNIKMFIGEVVSQLVDIGLIFQQGHVLSERLIVLVSLRRTAGFITSHCVSPTHQTHLHLPEYESYCRTARLGVDSWEKELTSKKLLLLSSELEILPVQDRFTL